MHHHKTYHHWKLWLGSALLLIVFGLGSVNCVVGAGTGQENTNTGDGGAITDSTVNNEQQPDTQVTQEATPEATQEALSEATQEATPEPVKETTPAAPKVVSTTPKDGESLQQPPNRPIQITVIFDQDMDVSTFTQTALTIKPSVSGKVAAGKDDKTLVFAPDQPLTSPQTFEVTVATSVLSKTKVALAKPYTFTFSTTLQPGPAYLGALTTAGGTQTGAVTHYSVMGHNTITGSTDGQGSHTVQNGFVYSFR